MLIAIFNKVPSTNISELGCPHPGGAAAAELHCRRNSKKEKGVTASAVRDGDGSGSRCPTMRGRGGGEDGKGGSGTHGGVGTVSLWKTRLVVWTSIALLQIYAVLVFLCLFAVVLALAHVFLCYGKGATSAGSFGGQGSNATTVLNVSM